MDKSTTSAADRAGWEVREWSGAVPCSRALTYELIRDGKIASVKLGVKRIITTSPRAFLESLRGEAA